MEKRFAFGDNWKAFSNLIDESRLQGAVESMSRFVGKDLSGRTFLDVGCGSGIHSLVARKLGAVVVSFDYDPSSVQCTASVKSRFVGEDDFWQVNEGSILDESFVSGLGRFDIVYSWGVLHHTGAMWKALENTMNLVDRDGLLFIAIYDDQGWKSQFWWYVKYLYNSLPAGVDRLFGISFWLVLQAINIAKHTLRFQPMVAIKPLFNYHGRRGMSVYHDVIDWMGGFPYEVATYETLAAFCKGRGFELVMGERADSFGCHQMLFQRCDDKQEE